MGERVGCDVQREMAFGGEVRSRVWRAMEAAGGAKMKGAGWGLAAGCGAGERWPRCGVGGVERKDFAIVNRESAS